MTTGLHSFHFSEAIYNLQIQRNSSHSIVKFKNFKIQLRYPFLGIEYQNTTNISKSSSHIFPQVCNVKIQKTRFLFLLYKNPKSLNRKEERKKFN